MKQVTMCTTAAAAAKSLQSCPTLWDPIDGSPRASPVPGILQARTLEWFAISFSNAWKWKVKVKSLSLVRLLGTPWTAAHQAPPSMRFSRQEYWSGVPLPSPVHNCMRVYFVHPVMVREAWCAAVDGRAKSWGYDWVTEPNWYSVAVTPGKLAAVLSGRLAKWKNFQSSKLALPPWHAIFPEKWERELFFISLEGNVTCHRMLQPQLRFW